MDHVRLAQLVVFCPCVTACLFPNLDGLRSDTDASTTDAPADAQALYCDQAPHTFCDDFDHGPLNVRWTIGTDPQTTETIVNTAWSSAPSSFYSRVDNPTQNVYAWVNKKFSGPMTQAHVAFDVTKLVSTTKQTANGSGFFSTSIHVASGLDCNFILENDGTNTRVHWQAQGDGGTNDYGFVLSPGLDLTKWSRIGIDFVKGSTLKATVTVNGTIALTSAQFDSLVATCGFGDTVFVGVGMYYTIGPTEGYYDNVTYDQK